MINQFKGRGVIVFGNGGAGAGTEVLEYYSLNNQNECECLAYLSESFELKYPFRQCDCRN